MNVLDGGGVTSYLVYYSMVCALVGSTLLVFIYLWFKGRLDMDEEAKYQMMLTDEERNEGI
jgi:hypothetical protein